MAWTEARIEELSRLWKAGNSASQCARILGNTTRAAVIGKVHRLGIAERGVASMPKPAKAKSVPKKTVVPQEPPASIPRAVQPAVPVFANEAVSRLERFMCRWPIGDPNTTEFHFCAQNAKGGGPYCEAHRVSAYQHRSQQKRRA